MNFEARAVLSEEEIAARLIYRDAMMLILDKPAGMPVHRGPKGGPNLEDSFQHLRFGLPRNPALAHRLDRDTSGCLALGRHHKALEKLGLLFKQGKIGKTYLALTKGPPAGPGGAREGLIDLPLGRLDASRGWRMKVDPAGQPARTRWRMLAQGRAATLLALSPLTGRTHQLRVHCAAMGVPILGDPVYGEGGDELPLQLHARAIVIPLYKNREAVSVTAPIPPAMRAAISAFGLGELDPDESA